MHPSLRAFLIQNMRAIATHFDGQIFRSRLEAYSYEYLRIHYRPLILHYEPKHYQGDHAFYMPDFVISHDRFHFAVEVKSSMDKASFPLYSLWLSEFTDIQKMLVFTQREAIAIYPHGTKLYENVDRMKFFQAVNNVKEYIRISNQQS